MSQSSLSKWLKAMIIALAMGGLFVCLWFLPVLGMAVKKAYPEFAYCYYPWLIFLWITAIPCWIALSCSWKIAVNIGRNHAFTRENGTLFQRISQAAAVDSIFFVVTNIIYLFLNMSHPSIFLLSLAAGFVGGAVFVVCAGLSTLVTNAAELQEQSDLTI